jgi:hypothetical protein
MSSYLVGLLCRSSHYCILIILLHIIRFNSLKTSERVPAQHRKVLNGDMNSCAKSKAVWEVSPPVHRGPGVF